GGCGAGSGCGVGAGGGAGRTGCGGCGAGGAGSGAWGGGGGGVGSEVVSGGSAGAGGGGGSGFFTSGLGGCGLGCGLGGAVSGLADFALSTSAMVASWTAIGCSNGSGAKSEGRPKTTSRRSVRCNRPERIAPLRITHFPFGGLVAAAGLAETAVSVISATWVNPAEVTLPITTMTLP